MKTTYVVAFLCLASICVLVRQSYCQQSTIKYGAVTHTPLRDVTLHLDHADVDEHILTLARTEDCNIIADASRFPQETELLTEDTTDSFGNFLLILAYQRHLAWAKIGEGSNGRGTFAIWSDQDIQSLAQRVLNVPVPWINKAVSAQEWEPIKYYIGSITAPDGTRVPQYIKKYRESDRGLAYDLVPLSDNSPDRIKQRTREIAPLLLPYLQKTYGWDGKAPNFVKQLPVSELPPELRDNLLARLQGQQFHPRRMAGYRLWFKEDFTSPKARIKTVEDRKGIGISSLVLSDYAPDEQQEVLSSRFLYWSLPTQVMPPQTAPENQVPTPPETTPKPQPQPQPVQSPDRQAQAHQTDDPVLAAQDVYDSPAPTLPLIVPPDAALQGKVSFEIKRQPLSRLLRDLSTQHKVNLSVADGADPNAPLTARVHDLSLADTLTSLARLYRAAWVKTDERTYQLRKSGKTDLRIRMEQLGDMDWFRIYAQLGSGPERVHVTPITIWKPILSPVVDVSLMNPDKTDGKGMLVSALPLALQRRMREEIREKDAIEIVTMFRGATLKALSQAVLTINSTPSHIVQKGNDVTDYSGSDMSVGALGYDGLLFDLRTLATALDPVPPLPEGQG